MPPTHDFSRGPETSIPAEPQLINKTQLARAIGVTPRTIDNWVQHKHPGFVLEAGQLRHGKPTPNIQHPMGKRAEARGRRAGLVLPGDASPGDEEDWRELGELRHVSHHAAELASRYGTLFFGTVCGFRCWIITDQRRLCAEARRMDGELFPPAGALGERKAHTFKGSVKNWPVGLAVRGFDPGEFRAFLAVEGGPDYLAAFHFALAGDGDCLPIAFLGAGAATTIHPEAQAILAGRRVRFYQHHDASQAGQRAVAHWSRQLASLGSEIDAFDFEGLRRFDSVPVKDLNDCTQLCNRDAAALEGALLP